MFRQGDDLFKWSHGIRGRRVDPFALSRGIKVCVVWTGLKGYRVNLYPWDQLTRHRDGPFPWSHDIKGRGGDPFPRSYGIEVSVV